MMGKGDPAQGWGVLDSKNGDSTLSTNTALLMRKLRFIKLRKLRFIECSSIHLGILSFQVTHHCYFIWHVYIFTISTLTNSLNVSELARPVVSAWAIQDYQGCLCSGLRCADST